jgi:hypothetical protein
MPSFRANFLLDSPSAISVGTSPSRALSDLAIGEVGTAGVQIDVVVRYFGNPVDKKHLLRCIRAALQSGTSREEHS